LSQSLDEPRRASRSGTHNARHKERLLDPAYWARFRCYRLKLICQKKGLPFALTPDDLVMPKLCPVLGIPLEVRGRGEPNTPSVDRVIPALGYVRGNVRVISWRANKLKSDCTDPDEMEAVADYIRREKKAVERLLKEHAL